MNRVWRCEHLKKWFCILKAQLPHYQIYAIIASIFDVTNVTSAYENQRLTNIFLKYPHIEM